MTLSFLVQVQKAGASDPYTSCYTFAYINMALVFFKVPV